MNRETRRRMAKAEKKGKVLATTQLTDNCKMWIEYCKKNNIDFNAFFIAFSGWLNLSTNEKSATVVELVSEGLVTPDPESKNSVESGWKKVNSEGEIIDESDSEGEQSVSDTVLVSEVCD